MAPELKPEDIGLHSLKPADGSRKDRKRVGRGHGSGHGKTSGRGHKGYGSRSGAKQRTRFEGGQNPLHMRMRKLRGPNKKMSMPFEPFRTHTQPVNIEDLEARFDAGASVDLAATDALARLAAAGGGLQRVQSEITHRSSPGVARDAPCRAIAGCP